MSLEQYKDASRAELWNVLQIQSQVIEEEIRKNADLEKGILNNGDTVTMPKEAYDLIIARIEELQKP